MTVDQEITEFVDVDAPPPGPSALIVFGTNQLSDPVRIAADRHHRGLAPIIVTTGGRNRHNGVVEGLESRRMLAELDVPADAVKCEERSSDTWQNVELSLSHLTAARSDGLPITAVAKWYHLRAVYALFRFVPAIDVVYAIGWDPVYDGAPVTRAGWPRHDAGRRRVLREWEEITRRVGSGELAPIERDGGWRVTG